MRKKEVDLIDLRIIKILSENANISNKDLAEKINLSQAPTLVRVRNLFNNKVLLNYTVALNYKYFGYTSRYLVQITLFKEYMLQLEHIYSKFRTAINLQSLEPINRTTKNTVVIKFEYMLKENGAVDDLIQALQVIPDILDLQIYRLENVQESSEDLFFLSEEDIV
jgi:DNA-binding Lrp family transcriptional regulator